MVQPIMETTRAAKIGFTCPMFVSSFFFFCKKIKKISFLSKQRKWGRLSRTNLFQTKL